MTYSQVIQYQKIPGQLVRVFLFNNKKSMNYIFKKDGQEIKAIPEVWVWGVVYKDGTELKQFGDDGIFHQIGEINQDEVAMFVMYKFGEEEKRIDLPVEGKQIFHFYRNLVLAYNTDEKRRIKIYCFGYKDKETGVSAYHFILPDDRLVISDKDLDLTKFNI